MGLLGKRWSRTAWASLTVGLIVVIGYGIGAGRYNRFFLPSTASADAAAQDSDDGVSVHYANGICKTI